MQPLDMGWKDYAEKSKRVTQHHRNSEEANESLWPEPTWLTSLGTGFAMPIGQELALWEK